MFTHSRRTSGLLAGVLFAVFLIGACSMDPTALSEAARSAAAADERCYTCEDDPPTPPSSSLGSASGFVILGGPAVTITSSVVTGDVGTGFPGAPVTVTLPSTVDGTVHEGDAISQAAYNDFLLAYIALTPEIGEVPAGGIHIAAAPTAVDLADPFAPGVYYNEAAVTFTNVTLTLDAAGDPNATWTFLIGTDGTGALTGTNFTVALLNGADPCNITWWVAEAVTMTTSSFQGSILAGAGITFTGPGSLVGRAFGKAAVTLTAMDPFDLCVGADPGEPGKPGKYGDRVTGGGWIGLPDRGKGTFAVSAGIKNGVLRGQLEYSVHSYRGRWGHTSTSFKVKGTGITQYLVVDAVTRHIEGTAKVNGVAGFTYKVDVSDKGEGRRGRYDTFAISVYDASGALVYSASGALAGGNIQLHEARGGRGGWGWGRD